MKKILCFAGSNSSTSINHEWVSFAASKVTAHHTKIIKLNDYPLDICSEDIEREKGYSVDLQLLRNEIKAAEGIILSVNEHNGAPSAFFKNILDWLSRIEYKFLDGKKVLLMSTSNGARGGSSALEYVKARIPRHNGELVESFSFPLFSDNFSLKEKVITNEILAIGFIDVLQHFEHKLNS